jgi:hypothetical protein
MNSECSINQQRIPRSLLGDLPREEEEALISHLAACATCTIEHQRFAETVSILERVEDEPVPRHFFIHQPEQTVTLWHLFRHMKPRWQIATACAAAAMLLLSIAFALGLEIESGQGSWSISLGRAKAMQEIDIAALKAEILRETDQRNRELALNYVRALRAEIAGTRSDLTQQRQAELISSLNALDARINNRISSMAEDLRTSSQNSSLAVYQSVSMQREADINGLSKRIEKVVDDFEAEGSQTDAILETLLQIANLNFEQPGDQK